MLGHKTGERWVVAAVEQALHIGHHRPVVHLRVLQVVSPVDAVAEHVLIDRQHQFELDL